MSDIDELLGAHRLNDRVGTALFDGLLGLRVTRPSYVKLTELDERTATRGPVPTLTGEIRRALH